MNKNLNTVISTLRAQLTQLNEAELNYVNLVKSNNKQKVLRQVQLIESKIKGLKTLEEKELAKACVDSLKEVISKKSLKEAAYKVSEFKETVKILLEAEYYLGEYRTKVKDFKNLKDIVISVLTEDRSNPETLYVSFATPFYPTGNDFSSLNVTLLDLEKKWSSFGRSVQQKAVKGTPGFTGGLIWDSSLRTDLVEPGSKINAHVEAAIYIQPGSINATDEKALVNFVSPFLIKVDNLISEEFKNEINPKYQKEYNTSEGKDSRVDMLKYQKSKISRDDRDEVSTVKDKFVGNAF